MHRRPRRRPVCLVISMILSSRAPWTAALVTNPVRSECPSSPPDLGQSPARSASRAKLRPRGVWPFPPRPSPAASSGTPVPRAIPASVSHAFSRDRPEHALISGRGQTCRRDHPIHPENEGLRTGAGRSLAGAAPPRSRWRSAPRPVGVSQSQKDFSIGFVYLPGAAPSGHLLDAHAQLRDKFVGNWFQVTGGRSRVSASTGR